jgi:hypothetical protein
VAWFGKRRAAGKPGSISALVLLSLQLLYPYWTTLLGIQNLKLSVTSDS